MVCAAVEAGSTAIETSRDTRRRRSCTGWREGLSGLGRTLVGRRCTRDCGPWILNLSFAAACSNNRDADKAAIRFSHFAHAAFFRARGIGLSAMWRISPKRTFKRTDHSELKTDLSRRPVPSFETRIKTSLRDTNTNSCFRIAHDCINTQKDTNIIGADVRH